MFTEDYANGETPEESLDGFIDFLKGKPSDGTYQWPNSCECACAQYLKSIGKYRQYWLGRSDDIMGKLNRIAGGDWEPSKWDGAGGYKESEWTFGKCLERAKKVKEAARPREVALA